MVYPEVPNSCFSVWISSQSIVAWSAGGLWRFSCCWSLPVYFEMSMVYLEVLTRSGRPNLVSISSQISLAVPNTEVRFLLVANCPFFMASPPPPPPPPPQSSRYGLIYECNKAMPFRKGAGDDEARGWRRKIWL